jgi:hypothetical protein
MVTVMLPSHLSDLVDDEFSRPFATTVLVKPGSWLQFVQELRDRYPRLAERVFKKPGTIASGFALVLNDQVIQGDYVSLQINSGDEMCILVTIAGG